MDAMAARVIRETVSKVVELTQLLENWDSYGAAEITKDAICGAYDLAYNLFFEATPLPDVFPVPNGNIQMEWSCLGLDLEIEILSRRKLIASFQDLESDINWTKEFTNDFTELAGVIAKLTERNRPKKHLRVA